MKLLFVVAALMVSISAFASQELAQKNGCLACHGVDKKIIGPAYKDVAKKYANKNSAPVTLFTRVKMGSRGVWGDEAMPPNPQVSDADLKRIIAWILSLK